MTRGRWWALFWCSGVVAYLVALFLIAMAALLVPVLSLQFTVGEPPVRVRSKAPQSTARLMEITAYTCGVESTGKTHTHPAYCITSSGYKLTDADAYRIVAADPNFYPEGTKLFIKGLLHGTGEVIVMDIGGDIKGPDRLDLFVGKTAVREAITFGRKTLEVDKR